MNKLIECRNLTKSYHDGTRELQILRGVDLVVPEGETLAISGPSGVGKSTLLHLMGALDQPSAGDVFFRGAAMRAMGRAALNRMRNEEIGFVFQFYHLLPEFTALENVMMPAICKGARRAACRERGEALLEKVGLADRMRHKPGQLSGGEQQRVAIARALFNKPRIVLSDEPTGNLDENTSGGIIDLLWRLNAEENVSLVIVTHDEAFANDAQHWIHLHEGKAEVRK